jgi:phage/plasmid primase-like uncharacterized protein
MSFEQFARACGLLLPARWDDSGRIKRCGTIHHPRSTNGAYAWDGQSQRGWAQCFDDPDGNNRPQWHADDNAKPWTEADKAAWLEKKRRAAQEREASYRRAAAEAAETIRQCSVGDHNYMAFKGLRDRRGNPIKTLVRGADMIVPMTNIGGGVMGLQRIFWDAEERRYVKKFMTGMRATGAVHRLGPASKRLSILCEGFATAHSIKQAVDQTRMDATVIACMSAHNIQVVAEQIKGRPAIVMADCDRSGAGRAAAEATGLPWCQPEIEGFDYNDLHVKKGIFEVAHALMSTAMKTRVCLL